MNVELSKNKIVFIGNSGVGKTSLVSLLLGKDSNSSPTIGLEIEGSVLNGKKCAIWDCGGQEHFKFMWEDFLKGAGLTVLVCDSTEANLQKTKEIYNRFSRNLGSKVIAIANKQDLNDALSAEQIQAKLGIKTYEMSAIKKELREKMKEILESEIAC